MLPLDRAALAVIVGLSVLIGGVLWAGDQTYPRVRDFSWQHQRVGIDDRAFILTFNRPMDWETVAANLRLSPSLPGKLSWSGRRLAYTLTEPIPYGQAFRVELTKAEAATVSSGKRRPLQPFVGEFRSRDRAFVYLGVAGSENGRLVLTNFTQKSQRMLTPPELNVLEFKVNPGQNRVVFTAIRRDQPDRTRFDAQLYAVPLRGSTDKPPQAQLILDNTTHQILQFDVNPYDDQIVIQRFGIDQSGKIQLWRLATDNTLTAIPFETDGSTFTLAPDGQTLAIGLNQGMTLVSLQDQTGEPQFLPRFSVPLGFTPDGTAALMVRKNPDQTRSLFWVPTQGAPQEILQTTGYIFDAQSDRAKTTVYCLYSRFNSDAEFRTDLHLSAIEVATGKQLELATFPNQLSGHFSLAPDDSALIYEEIQVTDQSHPSVVRNILGQTITSSRLWRFNLTAEPFDTTQTPEQAQSVGTGIKAQWIP